MMARWSPHPVTLRQLQYATAVAKFGSFRKAAEACAIAQPSLSAQIAQLESALGVVLFERLPRGVTVTEAGRAVLERAEHTLRAADDLVASAESRRDPEGGTLRVGVIPTVAPYLLPEIMPRLRKRYPRMQFVWVEEKTAPLLARLQAGALDAGLMALDQELGELAHAELGRDPFLLAVPVGHRLARAEAPAQLDHLDGETVLLLDDGHCFRDQVLSVCQRAGADEASVRATSLSTLAQMVAGGAGITLLPRLAIATENRARSLVTRTFGPRGPSRTLVMVWRRTLPAAPTVSAIADLIRQALPALLR
jgi:LysR family transcriptional regulator, hydrogen peroxide-inducible genes activator